MEIEVARFKADSRLEKATRAAEFFQARQQAGELNIPADLRPGY
jgi:hypothetical protein